MNLNDFATPICSNNCFIKASFGGFAGSGKTRTGTEFIIGCYKYFDLKKPIMIIDNEKGSRFLIPIFAKAGIKTLIKETVNLADVLMAFKFLESGEIDFLFIDSLTKVWYKFIDDYLKKAGKVSMTLQDWGKVIPSWQKQFANRYVELNGSCVFTGRGGYTYELVEDEESKRKNFARSGVKMKVAGETAFEPDINIWMSENQDTNDGDIHQWREAFVMKDRSSIIDGKTFKNPTFKDFLPVIEFIAQTPQGDVAGETMTDNLAPHEIYDEKRDKREILIAKIKACFDKKYFGTTKEDKAHKVMIAEKIFGVSTFEEVEKFRLEKLEKDVLELEAFFTFWNEAENKQEYIKNYVIEEIKF